MKMDKVAGSGNDEFYTPKYAIKPIIKYLAEGTTVWCPFDTNESNFVIELINEGYNVINSHINDGTDFFKCDVPDCDYIISNPPYSKKTEVLERLFVIDRPFAMLVGVVGLFESRRRFEMFSSNSFEIMYFNKRISYLKSYNDETPSLNPPFSSVYICHDVLPEKIMFERL